MKKNPEVKKESSEKDDETKKRRIARLQFELQLCRKKLAELEGGIHPNLDRKRLQTQYRNRVAQLENQVAKLLE